MKAGVNLERRNTLKTGGGLGLFAVAGQTQPGVASADWLKAASEAMAMDEALGCHGRPHHKNIPQCIKLGDSARPHRRP